MKVICYSSFTFGYLNRARVLFASVKRFHPDWHCVALITDIPPAGFQWRDDEAIDEIVYAKDLGIKNFESWLFKLDVIEACTAVKGPYLLQACKGRADVVIYLDPDTCLFNVLEPLLKELKRSDIVITPHQIHPDDERSAIVDNEITSLKTGIYNLGFLAVKTTGEGQRMAHWWNDRLLEFCHDDIPNGLFVDQRWCDHIPSFFENVKILKDPGYNVASWNLSHRTVDIDRDGEAHVNGVLLRFWHFTKLGPLGDIMTKRYAQDNFPVYELWAWYRDQVALSTGTDIPRGYWAFGFFDDGAAISKEQRVLYRHRKDLQQAFPNPYASGEGTLQSWLANEGVA